LLVGVQVGGLAQVGLGGVRTIAEAALGEISEVGDERFDGGAVAGAAEVVDEVLEDVGLVVGELRPAGVLVGEEVAVGRQELAVRECEVVGLQQQEVALQVVEVDLPVLEREQLALGENLELSLGLVMRVLPEVVPVARDRGDRNLGVVRVDDEAAVDLGVVRWQGRAVALRQRVAALRTRADWGISCNLYALPPRTHRPPCTRPCPGLSSAALAHAADTSRAPAA